MADDFTNLLFRPGASGTPPDNGLAPAWQQRIPVNPIGTERIADQSMSTADPGFQPGVNWGGSMVSQPFYNLAQGAMSNALGWVGSSAPGEGGFTAYHGSPHSFDAFDTSKIGTGEGAQAYGHGLYTAGNEAVAQTYKFAGQPSYMNTATAQIAQDAHTAAVASGAADPIAAARNTLWEQRQATTDPIERRRIDDAYNNIETLTKPGGPGHMYEVQVNADPAHFLDWDKPLSEQSPQVREALDKIPLAVRDAAYEASGNHDPTGAQLHEALRAMNAQTRGTSEAASEALSAAGIKGIRYLDQGSRASGQGTYNHVVFDAATLEILRKYGIAGLMAGGGAAAAGTQQQPSQ